MEDEAQLESLSSKLDASLFAVGTSNKKRPNAITFGEGHSIKQIGHSDPELGEMRAFRCILNVSLPCPARMFSNRLLDMCELVVHDFKPMSSFKVGDRRSFSLCTSDEAASTLPNMLLTDLLPHAPRRA
jgi:ribosome production factor 2